MDHDKYSPQISMLCPTCGSDQFAYDEGAEMQRVTCASCGREMAKDELKEDNMESIHEHTEEMSDQIVHDAAEDFRKSLKSTLKGNKYVKMK